MLFLGHLTAHLSVNKELMLFCSTELLPEHRGGSAGASCSTYKTAPSAGDNRDLYYIPGFAIRPPLSSHTVNCLI